jgi:Bacteriocin-protection, YdeI or OmpD-Associated/Domain of unknown function (DUF1905)
MTEHQSASFRTTILLAGKTATGIQVPQDIVRQVGAGKRTFPVRVTLGEHAYRTTLVARGDRYLVPVSAENREAAGVTAGDEVDVELSLDTEPREVTVPADFADALDRAPEARRFFDGLTHSQKQAYVVPIEVAKKPETRQRRIDKALTMLRDGRKR